MGFMKTLFLKLAHADLNEMLNGNILDVPHVLTDSNFGTNILYENAGLTSNNFLEWLLHLWSHQCMQANSMPQYNRATPDFLCLFVWYVVCRGLVQSLTVSHSLAKRSRRQFWRCFQNRTLKLGLLINNHDQLASSALVRLLCSSFV